MTNKKELAVNRFIKFLFLPLIVSLCLLISGCGHETIKGEGASKQEKREVSQFSGLEVDGAYAILGKVGSPQELVIASNPNILPYINTSVDDDMLIIKSKGSVKLQPSGSQNIWFTAKQLNTLRLKGASQFQITNVGTDDFNVSLEGSHKVYLKGKANSLTVKINGSSTINAKNLSVDDANIEINGSGVVALKVANNLKVKINGDGRVIYYDTQPKVEQTINGSGVVSSAFGALDKEQQKPE